MRVLVTRPGEDGARLAELLRARGQEPVIEPLIEINLLDGPPLMLDGVQALLLTSANGARALARRTERRDAAVFAVGDATALVARDAGFTNVTSAGGNVDTLADLVKDKLDPARGILIHVAGTEVAGDLAGQLGAAGFICRREVLYAVDPSRALSLPTVAAIKEGRIDIALAYSPRTAETLASLLRKARLVRDCRAIELLCLSQAVAEAASDIPWRSVAVAAEPTQEALLKLVEDRAGEPAPTPVSPPPPKRARTGLIGWAALAVVALLAGAAYFLMPYWLPLLQPPPQPTAAAEDPRIAQLQARLDRVERDLAALKAERAQPAPGADVGDRIAQLEAQSAEKLAQLQRQIDTVQKSIPADVDPETVKRARLVFAIGRLRDAVISTRPYAVELAALRTLAGDDRAVTVPLDKLSARADTGVPSIDSLREGFKPLANKIAAAGHAPVGEQWWDKAWAKVQGAVSWRRTDESGSDPDAVLARAEHALARADVATAAAEIDTLPPDLRALATKWRAEADALITANQALGELQAKAFAELGR